MPPTHVDPNAHTPSSDEDELVEFDLVQVMNEMTVPQRRKVYALQGLFNDFKAIRAQMREEIAKVQMEHAEKLAKLFAIRLAIVSGERDVDAEEIAGLPATTAAEADTKEVKKGVKVVAPSDEKANDALVKAASSRTGGIPSFWLTAMSNCEAIDGMITERDRDALSHLTNITSEFVGGHPHKGVVLHFAFSPNPYFTDATLTKTYNMAFNEDDGDVEVETIVGCDIHWVSPQQNLTKVIKQKKQRNKKNNQMRIVEREEPCDSFFNFFSPPKEPGSGNDESGDDEDEEFFEQAMEMDVEAGQAFMEEIVPKGAYYYTGKAVEEVAKELRARFGFGEDEDEEDEDDEEEDSEAGNVDFKSILNRGGRGGGSSAGGRGGAAGPPQQECKQQ